MGKRGPKAFSEEFRREAVRLAEAGPKSITLLARELGVSHETLRSWCRTARSGESSGAKPGTVPSLEEENSRLRRENARLLEEREILKKATAFFARDAR